MGMDMIYYEKEIKEERCNQAKETIIKNHETS